MHFVWCDFGGTLPADGSSQASYKSAFGGLYPAESYNFVSDLAARNMTIQSGGPSQSGKYSRKISTGHAQGGYWMRRTENDSGYPGVGAFIAYVCNKIRTDYSVDPGDGNPAGSKKYRWSPDGNARDFYFGHNGDIRESGEWPYQSAAFHSHTIGSVSFSRDEYIMTPNSNSIQCVHITDNVAKEYTGYFPGSIEDVPHPFKVPLVNDIDSTRNCSWSLTANSTENNGIVDYTDLYQDFTLKRVELWNTAGTIHEIQLCKSWSSTSIVIACNRGALSLGAVKVKIIDIDNTVIATQDAVLS